MGQYYLGYVKHNKSIKVFDNAVDGEWNGLKLMEHSWWLNSMVGNVVNDLFYNTGRVCWVGDYYAEDNYHQINYNNEISGKVKEIGDLVWKSENKKNTKCSIRNVRYLFNCLLVNHSKKEILVCDDYYKNNMQVEKYDGKEYSICIHPLPLLTCTASHSGGSYYGVNKEKCGIWFNDEIEVVLSWDLDKLLEKGYKTVMFEFKE